MEDSNEQNASIKLQISFPKSNEDHRLQLIEINGAIFAILHSLLESNGPIHLNCKEWSLVLLAPIRSKSNIVISAINIICLNEVKSEEGTIEIEASNQLVKLTPCIKPSEKAHAKGKKGEFELQDDPGTYLKYFKLFNTIVSGVRNQDSALSEAQQNVILTLCALAEKIEGKTKNLTISTVLDIWDIPDNSPGKTL